MSMMMMMMTIVDNDDNQNDDDDEQKGKEGEEGGLRTIKNYKICYIFASFPFIGNG